LEDKDKVKVNMFFRGREMSHKELGRQILDRVITDTTGLAQPEKSPALEGRIMSVVLTPAGGDSRAKAPSADEE
jgi:translation initiation factor IF-3